MHLQFSYLEALLNTNGEKNIRLQNSLIDDTERILQYEFDQQILDVGDRKIKSLSFNREYEAATIELPDDLLLKVIDDDPIKTICNTAYGNFMQNYQEKAYLQFTAIVTPYNETVDILNDYMLSLLKGDTKTYLSCDSISRSTSFAQDEDQLYLVEYLNSFSFSGFLNHKIRLKIRAVIMLLRNINQTIGLCIGTWLIITQLGKYLMKAEIITGRNIRDKVFVPSIKMITKKKKVTLCAHLERISCQIILCYDHQQKPRTKFE